jgi:hypothetical protein
MYKIIVSFTTSPSRIYRIEPIIKSILNQDYKPYKIEINVPEKYKNKEEYIIPDFLLEQEDGMGNKYLKYPNVSIVRTGKDIGPSSKVIPTLIRYKDDPEVFIVSIDDDHQYPENILSVLVKGLHMYGDKNIYGLGGLDVYAAPGMKMSMYGYNKTYQVSTIEGVFGVLYNPRLVEDDIVEYYDKIMNCSECITSDDITISNYFAWKKIPITRLHFKSMDRWKLKGMFRKGLVIKDSDKDENAIHLMSGGHGKRYFSACAFLKSQNMLYIKISRGSKFR